MRYDNDPDFQVKDFYKYDDYKAKIQAEGLAFPARLAFTYTGSTGEVTRRLIDGIALLDNNLLAYCYLRGAARTFYVNSMEDVHDPRNDRTFRNFKAWLKHGQPPEALPPPSPAEIALHNRLRGALSYEAAVAATNEMVASLTALGGLKWSFDSFKEGDAGRRRLHVNVRSVKLNGEKARLSHSSLQLVDFSPRYCWSLYRSGKGESLYDDVAPLKEAWRDMLRLKI